MDEKKFKEEFVKALVDAILGNENQISEDEIKQKSFEFKKNIKELDDDLFIEYVEDIESKIDLKEFNELLDKENLNKEEINKLYDYINLSNEIITDKLYYKINFLKELMLRF